MTNEALPRFSPVRRMCVCRLWKCPQYTSTSSLPSFLKIYFIFDHALAVGGRCVGECRYPGGQGLWFSVRAGQVLTSCSPSQDSSFICLRNFLISSQVCPLPCFLLIFMRIWGGVKLPTHWSGHAAGSDLWQLIANVYAKLLIVQRNGNP